MDQDEFDDFRDQAKKHWIKSEAGRYFYEDKMNASKQNDDRLKLAVTVFAFFGVSGLLPGTGLVSPDKVLFFSWLGGVSAAAATAVSSWYSHKNFPEQIRLNDENMNKMIGLRQAVETLVLMVSMGERTKEPMLELTQLKHKIEKHLEKSGGNTEKSQLKAENSFSETTFPDSLRAPTEIQDDETEDAQQMTDVEPAAMAAFVPFGVER